MEPESKENFQKEIDQMIKDHELKLKKLWAWLDFIILWATGQVPFTPWAYRRQKELQKQEREATFAALSQYYEVSNIKDSNFNILIPKKDISPEDRAMLDQELESIENRFRPKNQNYFKF